MIFQNFGFNQNYPVVATGGGNDPDAQAFIDATGISGTTATAINQLVLDLKSYSLWTKMAAIYPLVGGSSSSTSYNLKNVATYQISWNGTITFATNGVTGNGSNGYGDTGLTPSSVLSTSMHLSAYIRTAGNAAAYDIGCSNYPVSPTSTPENMVARFDNDRYSAFGAINGSPYLIVNTANTTGFFVGNNLSNTGTTYRNGSSIASASKTLGLATRSVGLLGQLNGNGPADLSSRQYAFYSIGDGLDGTENSNFNTAVAAFQTTLGRNV
jgi:hypothetical protein